MKRPDINKQRQMTQISDRDRLVRMTRGENLDNSMRYSIDYSLDIRGNITIWGGMSFYRFEAMPFIDHPSKRVDRNLREVYDSSRIYPYTARIFQMEQEIDETISDDHLIEELERFRKDHPEDGFGMRMMFIQLPYKIPDPREDTEGILRFREDRDDKQEVLDRLLKQERQDILRLWGVDCPPDINSMENYNRRLSQNHGMVSEWFRQEFARIGGDFSKLYRR